LTIPAFGELNMATMVRRLVAGAGVASAVAAGGVACWAHEKTKNLSPDQRGSVLARVQETRSAFQQARKMQDAYTAQHHPVLVASFPPKPFTMANNEANKEIYALATPHAVDISKVLRRNQGAPVFRYDANLPALLPDLPGESRKGFVFAGSFPEVQDPQARASLVNEDYVRCKSELEILHPETRSLKSVKDVLITGTSDPEKCLQFKNAFLRALACQAAISPLPLDPQTPYSDTLVFNEDLEATGDLTNMPATVQKQIWRGNFTVCNRYSTLKTRLSGGRWKDVGAVVAGTTNNGVCRSLVLKEIRQLIDEAKRQRE
jgi:hypothetical protein